MQVGSEPLLEEELDELELLEPPLDEELLELDDELLDELELDEPPPQVLITPPPPLWLLQVLIPIQLC